MSHWCSVQENFPCAHTVEALSHFLVYLIQHIWFYMEVLE